MAEYQKIAYGSSATPVTIEQIHLALDILGCAPIPVVAELADGTNAIIYLLKGDVTNAVAADYVCTFEDDNRVACTGL